MSIFSIHNIYSRQNASNSQKYRNFTYESGISLRKNTYYKYKTKIQVADFKCFIFYRLITKTSTLRLLSSSSELFSGIGWIGLVTP
jgi:hypothetical protein